MDTLKEVSEPVDISEIDSKTGKKKIKFDDAELKESANESNQEEISEVAMIIATILQYFVTPPYLTKTIFKQKFFKNFQHAKNFPKLTTLPFMKDDVSSKYREGLTVQMGKIHKPQGLAKKKSQPLKNTKYVNIGYDKYLELKGQQVPTNVRVTVNTETNKVVSPLEAYKETGAKSSYGYHVRIARKFSSIFTESSYPEGYSQSIWINSSDYFNNSKTKLNKVKLSKKDSNLLLIVSNWKDIEFSFNNDKKNLQGIENPNEFFDGELEIPSGTRIEDGAMIALTKISNI